MHTHMHGFNARWSTLGIYYLSYPFSLLMLKYTVVFAAAVVIDVFLKLCKGVLKHMKSRTMFQYRCEDHPSMAQLG